MIRNLTAACAALLASQAFAAVVATADTEGGRIDLHSDAGRCVGNAKRAEYIGADGEHIDGCWVVARGGVQVAFMDGDVAQIPMSAIRKPVTL